MAFFSPTSQAAIARLRSYVPPPTMWYSLPLSRRAAVLILLFPDKKGELRVVLTMRASTLTSYAGQAALPGGKSDSLLETPLQTARREAMEEIGLPQPTYDMPLPLTSIDSTGAITPSAGASDETKASPETPNLPYPFRIDHLCQLPSHLAKTELGVRPVVALLHATEPVDKNNVPVDAEATLIPRLDAKEVAAVFTGPLHNFLKIDDELPIGTSPLSQDGNQGKPMEKPEGHWYHGSWTTWHEQEAFRMHNFYVPVKNQAVTRPRQKKKAAAGIGANSDASDEQARRIAAQAAGGTVNPPAAATSSSSYPPPQANPLPYGSQPSSDEPDPLETLQRYRVFGMTARILVDCARVAYAEEPEFESMPHFGDETLLRKLLKVGKLGMERKRGEEFMGDDMRKVIKKGEEKGRL